MPWEERAIQLESMSITIIYTREQLGNKRYNYFADVGFGPTDHFVVSNNSPDKLRELLFRTILVACYTRLHQSSSTGTNQYV